MAKDEKRPKGASKTLHDIKKASVTSKNNIMTKEEVSKLKEDMEKKHAKYVNETENENTVGISTSQQLYLAAWSGWVNANRKYRAQEREANK